MARLNDHSKDLTNLVFLVRREVAEYVGVELQNLKSVSSDQTRHKTENMELDLILFI